MFAPRVPAHDANGFPVADEGFINSSFGNAYDRERMVRQYELNELQRDNAPKMDRVTQDQQYLKMAHYAMKLVQVEINKVIDETPRPTWLTNKEQFKAVVDAKLNQASINQLGQPYQNGDGSNLDKVVDAYDVRPHVADENEHKMDQISSQIQQMDALVNSINSQFDELAKDAKSFDDFKKFSAMGITSIDGIYAIDPGYFTPKDGDGRPVAYDPRNLLHGLQAIEHALKDTANVDGIKLYGPKAIEDLRNLVHDKPPSLEAQVRFNQNLDQGFTQFAQAAQPTIMPKPGAGLMN